jgi:hypothetical protein
MASRRAVLHAIALAWLFTSIAIAQTTFGEIRGRVLDPTGAAIPNAKVTVTNTATNIAKKTVSDESGAYEVGYLQPGTYSVAAEGVGLKGFVAENVILNANAIVLVDAKLQLGEVSSTVTVSAGAQVISPESAQFADTKNQDQYLETPMNDRGGWDSYVFSFMSLVPGVQPVGAYWIFTFAGTPPIAENFTVDGITTRDPLWGTLMGPANPSMEFMKEVTVQFGGNSAEYGSAGQATIVTKGGGNQFHGSGFEYYNTAGWNARDFFAVNSPFNVLNDFGGSVTGPIIRNKLFFAAAFEGFDKHDSTVFDLNVPSAGLRQGDFSGLKDSNGNLVVITDPTTGQPFPGNAIPGARLNATAVALQNAFYPTPNYGDPDSVVGNYRSSPRQLQQKQMGDVRVDYQLSSSNSLWGRFDMMRAPNLWFVDMPAMGYSNQLRATRDAILSDTHVFRANLINEARIGFSRNYNPYTGTLNGNDQVQKFGLTGLPANRPNVPALPTFNISGFQTIDSTEDESSAGNNYVFQDNVSWIRGRHTFKFGADLTRHYAANYAMSPSDAFAASDYGRGITLGETFTGAFTGNAYSDFLLGIPYTAGETTSGYFRDHWTNWSTAFFAQDDFRVNSRLTLNIGLRYELDLPYQESQGRIASFDPATGKLIVGTSQGESQLSSAFVASNLVPIVTASAAGLPSSLVHTYKKNFGPRIGLAYKLTPDGKTVFRAAYGIFYEAEPSVLWHDLSGGPFTGTSYSPPNQITNGVPTWQLPAMFPSSLLSSSTSLVGINPNFRSPQIQQWNFTLEREIKHLGVHATYTGTKSTQLPWVHDLNQVAPSTVPFSTSERPYPQFSSLLYYTNGANEFYNGLILSVERKFSNGFLFQAGYTWAKDLTDEQAIADDGYQPQNAYNLKADYGNSTYTRRQRLNFSAVYEIPTRAHGNLLVDRIARGWVFSLTGLAQSGQYYTPTFCGSDPANIGAGCGRPDRVANGNISNPTVSDWFNLSAFVVPPADAGRFGNSGVNILEGPGTWLMNFGVYKPFAITERFKCRLEGTFTNVLNHPNFSVPSAVITSGAANVIESTQAGLENAGSRTTRIGIRLDF